jgi:hypothetical protein
VKISIHGTTVMHVEVNEVGGKPCATERRESLEIYPDPHRRLHRGKWGDAGEFQEIVSMSSGTSAMYKRTEAQWTPEKGITCGINLREMRILWIPIL